MRSNEKVDKEIGVTDKKRAVKDEDEDWVKDNVDGFFNGIRKCVFACPAPKLALKTFYTALNFDLVELNSCTTVRVTCAGGRYQERHFSER